MGSIPVLSRAPGRMARPALQRRCGLVTPRRPVTLLPALLLLFAIAPSAAHPQHQRVRLADLAELSQAAGFVLHGRVVEVREEPHPQYATLATVRVTLEVLQSVRGATGRRFSFREFRPQAVRGSAVKVRSTAGYRVGEELVLFLYPESRAGFTSPVGAAQGRFRVSRDASGALLATNGLNNRGLFENVPTKAKQLDLKLSVREQHALTRRSGPVALQDLLSLARRFPHRSER